MIITTNFVADGKEDLHRLCLTSYHFPDGHMPKAEPHVNAKSEQAFHPTWPSVIVKMKSQSHHFRPKETVSHVSQEAGGIVGAAAPGKLPRNEHQVSNLCRSHFGTDGEKALIDAFSHEFGFAIHLLCAIHLRRKVKQHMQSCNFPDEHRCLWSQERKCVFGGPH